MKQRTVIRLIFLMGMSYASFSYASRDILIQWLLTNLRKFFLSMGILVEQKEKFGATVLNY
jgi:hypothetical protein